MSKETVYTKLEVNIGNWQLKADALNFILRRKSGRYYTVEGYYQRIEDAINAIADKRLRESDVTSITAVLREIRLLRKDIKTYSERINDYRQTLVREDN